MAEFTTEQQLRIDLHQAKLARALIEHGMPSGLADRAVAAGHYEYTPTGALRIAHGTTFADDNAPGMRDLVRTLLPSKTSGVDITDAQEAVKRINAERAAQPNPLAPRTTPRI